MFFCLCEVYSFQDLIGLELPIKHTLGIMLIVVKVQCYISNTSFPVNSIGFSQKQSPLFEKLLLPKFISNDILIYLIEHQHVMKIGLSVQILQGICSGKSLRQASIC